MGPCAPFFPMTSDMVNLVSVIFLGSSFAYLTYSIFRKSFDSTSRILLTLAMIHLVIATILHFAFGE